MTDTTKRLKAVSPTSDPFPWIIVSRTVNDRGFPEYNNHTLAESAQTEARALVYAERRAAEGFWVEVYREHYYYAPRRDQQEGE